MRAGITRVSPAPAALLLLLAATATSAADEPFEDEVESAPFAIVVEHEDGWRCGGALVSLRAALSTAACARGRALAPGVDLWARAPASPAGAGGRRVARIALPVDSQGLGEGERWSEEAWLGAVADVALLELEVPFGADARARPILMATGGECGGAGVCLAVRTPIHAGAPLRVGNATLSPPIRCSSAAPHWSAIADTAICLTGPQFCPSDWGVGVVCAGKLCGVLSRSARAPGVAREPRWAAAGAGVLAGAGAGAEEGGCGDTHAAQHVPSWRAFVHCAQTRHQCGRGKCASVCSERMLLEDQLEAAGGGEGGATTRAPSTKHTTLEGNPDYEDGETKTKVTTHSTTTVAIWSEAESEWRTHTRDLPLAPASASGEGGARAGASTSASTGWRRAGHDSVPTRTTASASSPAAAKNTRSTGRMAQFEFEPYRADFKIGEYGDNGANYDSGEDTPTRTTESRATTSSNMPEALLSSMSAPAASQANVTSETWSEDQGTELRSRSYTFRNPLAPFICIFLFGIDR